MNLKKKKAAHKTFIHKISGGRTHDEIDIDRYIGYCQTVWIVNRTAINDSLGPTILKRREPDVRKSVDGVAYEDFFLEASLSSQSTSSVFMTSSSAVKGKERSFTQSSGDCSSYRDDPLHPDDRSLYYRSSDFSQNSEESRPLISNRLDDIIQCSSLGRLYPPHKAFISSNFSLLLKIFTLIGNFASFSKVLICAC